MSQSVTERKNDREVATDGSFSLGSFNDDKWTERGEAGREGEREVRGEKVVTGLTVAGS